MTDLNELKSLLAELYEYFKETLDFKEDVKSVKLLPDKQNGELILGKTAHYDPENSEIVLYTFGRHPKDILRSFGHELVHHKQRCEGQFRNLSTMSNTYAQDDKGLREAEKQAYLEGNMLFRDWEDSKKYGQSQQLNENKLSNLGFVYYRGTIPGETKRIKTGRDTWDRYLFVTEKPENAKWYGSDIEKIILYPEAKILRERTQEFIRIAGKPRKGESMLEYVDRAALKAKAAGYDAIHFERQTDIGTAILNLDSIFQREKINESQQLNEGGAYGHMNHLYDNLELTFAQIKDIFQKAAGGELVGTEKVDGVNIYISYSLANNEPRAARNKGQLLGGGVNAKELSNKFADRGSLGEAFNEAFEAWNKVVRVVPKKYLLKLFGEDADIFYNAEIQDPRASNVVRYDTKNLIFHPSGHVYVNKQEQKIQLLPDSSENWKLLNSVLERQKKSDHDYNVITQAVNRLQALSNKEPLLNALRHLEQVQGQYSIKDEQTIEDYMIAHINEIFKKSQVLLPDEIQQLLIKRILGFKGVTINSIIRALPKNEDISAQKAKVRSVVANGKNILKTAIEPLEHTIHDFSVEMLKGLRSAFILDQDEEVKRLQRELATAIKTIEKTGDKTATQVLLAQMNKIKNIENVSAAAEGFVFDYNGKVYKFTGNFAPINQILGLFKYGKGSLNLEVGQGEESPDEVKNDDQKDAIVESIMASILQESPKQDALNKYPNEKQAVEYFIQELSSDKHKYLLWTMKQYVDLKGKVNLQEIELLDKIIFNVRLFDEHRKELEKKDLFGYKTFKELLQALEPLKQQAATSNNEPNQPSEEDPFSSVQDDQTSGKRVYEDKEWLIIEPDNAEQSCKYGAGTTWCISAEKENWFNHYKEAQCRPVFVINRSLSSQLTKEIQRRGLKSKKEIAAFLGTNEAGDLCYHKVAVVGCGRKQLNKVFPGIQFPEGRLVLEEIRDATQLKSSAEIRSKLPSEIFKKVWSFLGLYEFTEEEQLYNLEKYGPKFLTVLIEPAPKVKALVNDVRWQLEAVKQNGDAIHYIRNPSEAVQLEAVKKNGDAIRYVNNPSEAVQLDAVKKYGNAIKYINNPSEAVQLAAVKEHGYAIQYINNPSEAVQLEAVKRNGDAIQHISNPSEAVRLEAVKQDGDAIKYINNPSEAVQLEAVKKYGYAIKYINNPSEAVQLEAVKQNGYAIQHINNPSEAVQLEAVKQNGYAIQHINNPSEAVQLKAVKQNGYAIRYCPSKFTLSMAEIYRRINAEKDREQIKESKKQQLTENRLNSGSPIKVAFFPGAFKPPHAGHYNVVKSLLAEHGAEEVRIIISRLPRGDDLKEISVDAEQSLKVWEAYTKNDSKVSIQVSRFSTPLVEALEQMRSFGEGDTILFVASTKEDNKQRFAIQGTFNRTGSKAKFLPVEVPVSLDVGATQLRQLAIEQKTEEFYKYLPQHLSRKEKLNVWTIVTNKTRNKKLQESSNYGIIKEIEEEILNEISAMAGGAVSGVAGGIGFAPQKVEDDDNLVNEILEFIKRGN